MEDLPTNWEELYRQGYYPEDTVIVWADEDWSEVDSEWSDPPLEKYGDDTGFVLDHHEKTVKVPLGYDPETLQPVSADKKQWGDYNE